MAEVTEVGKVLEGQHFRDAIHIAVAPVFAAEKLYPSQAIGLLDSDESKATASASTKIGIVDPFLTHAIEPGVQFWLWLYPYTITSLRHNWTHPAFDTEKQPVSEMKSGTGRQPTTKEDMKIQKAQEAIDRIADQFDVTPRSLMNFADGWVNSQFKDYWIEGGRFEGMSLPDEFWTHYEIVRGTKVNEDKKHNFFSCSC